MILIYLIIKEIIFLIIVVLSYHVEIFDIITVWLGFSPDAAI